MRPLGIIVAVCLGACTAEGGEHSVQWLNYDRFVSEVQPILARDCGNPTCHGRADRPWSIYSQRNWRIDPDRVYLPEALSTDELEHNYTISCVFVSEAASPAESLLLLKPLGENAGVAHGGGVIFEGTSDRSYRVVLDWIEEGWSP